MSTQYSYRPLRVFEALIALATLASTYLALGGYLWYPAWIYIGSVSFATVSIMPTILSVVVVIVWWRSNHSVSGRVLAAFAVVTFLLSVYSIWSSIVGPGGVFWAAFFPLIAGSVLAVFTLLAQIIERVRRPRDSAPTSH